MVSSTVVLYYLWFKIHLNPFSILFRTSCVSSQATRRGTTLWRRPCSSWTVSVAPPPTNWGCWGSTSMSPTWNSSTRPSLPSPSTARGHATRTRSVTNTKVIYCSYCLSLNWTFIWFVVQGDKLFVNPMKNWRIPLIRICDVCKIHHLWNHLGKPSLCRSKQCFPISAFSIYLYSKIVFKLCRKREKCFLQMLICDKSPGSDQPLCRTHCLWSELVLFVPP